MKNPGLRRARRTPAAGHWGILQAQAEPKCANLNLEYMCVREISKFAGGRVTLQSMCQWVYATARMAMNARKC